MVQTPDSQHSWHHLRTILGSKWALQVLQVLSTGQYGFNEMQRTIDGITATMLSRRLKELECHGVVTKQVEPTTPPSTTYELTDEGYQFVEVLQQLESMVTIVECSGESECTTSGDRSRCATLGTC
ncbi:MAG: helix-turn-helix domain-containing protein [Natrialbaceae archaeon]|nr:helix-turn-helix domain-containing protein [Natrialbaceae archaeon]